MHDDQRYCRTCGRARDPEARFCSSCGSEHPAATASSRPTASGPHAVTMARADSAPTSSRSSGGPSPTPSHTRPVVPLVVACLVLVFVTATLGTFLVLDGDDPVAAGQDARVRTDPDPGPRAVAADGGHDSDRIGRGAEGAPPPGPTDGSSAPTSPTTPAPSTGTDGVAVSCWDGSTTALVASCSLPTGEAGLDWVFPDKHRQPCAPGDPQAVRVIWVTCDVLLPSGSSVMVNYTQWVSRDAALRYYEGLNVTAPLLRDGMRGWLIRAHSPNPPHKAALLYDDGPYSVTVYGYSEADRDAALDRVALRDPRQLRGVPVEAPTRG